MGGDSRALHRHTTVDFVLMLNIDSLRGDFREKVLVAIFLIEKYENSSFYLETDKYTVRGQKIERIIYSVCSHKKLRNETFLSEGATL